MSSDLLDIQCTVEWYPLLLLFFNSDDNSDAKTLIIYLVIIIQNIFNFQLTRLLNLWCDRL